MRRGCVLAACLGVLVFPAARPVDAGPVNPNVSLIGQPFMRWTNDPGDTSPKRLTMDPGEVEAMFDAYLNPYATGVFITSIADGGIEVEEGYFTLLRGLPGGLTLKGGKYRVGFGKMNVMHPHAVPFAERPRVLAAYLPGQESLNETGVSVSERIPVPGTFSLTASADVLQGDTYRIAREPSAAANDPLALDPDAADRAAEARPAFVAHVSGFGGIGDRSGYELALSATGGTNNVAARTETRVYAASAKLKLWTKPDSYLVVQTELLKLDREVAGWDETAATYRATKASPIGGYACADYAFSPRYNAGLLFERYEQPTGDKAWDQAVGAFAGLSLMEETTSFRLDWNRFLPGAPAGVPDPDAVDTVTLRVIFSMGPHKAHQF